MALFLDGRSIGAEEALTIGLTNEVIETSDCVQLAVTRASEWATRAGLALRAIKQGVLQVSGEQISAEVKASLEISRSLFATADMREGVAAFLEKRKPRFQNC